MEWTAGLEDNLPHVQSPVRPTPIRTGGAMSPVRPHHQVEPQLASPTGTFERALPIVRETNGHSPFESVVQIFTVSCEPSYLIPWQVSQQGSSSGSGFALRLGDGKMYIVTNAHVASSKHNTVLRVQKHGNAEKFPAHTICIGFDCDLALLQVDSEVFWQGLPSVRLAHSLPQLYETTQVIGYPVGGQSICITKGVISRVSLQHYTPEAPAGHLVIQIDAAINPGNSGGPAFSDAEEVVGVAFLKNASGNTDNVGWIIPIPVLQTFISQFEQHGDYQGMTQLGFRYRKLENPTFRKSLGMPPTQSGILVTEVAPLGGWADMLKPRDVILEVDDVQVWNDGSTLALRDKEMIDFSFLITSRTEGSTKIKMLREGKEITRSTQLVGRPSCLLCPIYHEADCQPTYFICGGLVFCPMTGALIEEFIKTGSYGSGGVILDQALVNRATTAYRSAAEEKEGTEIIILLRILVHDCNYGYKLSNGMAMVLDTVNGKSISTMKELVNMVGTCQEEFLSFNFDGQAGLSAGTEMVLERAFVEAATPEILATHRIPAAITPNLMDS